MVELAVVAMSLVQREVSYDGDTHQLHGVALYEAKCIALHVSV